MSELFPNTIAVLNIDSYAYHGFVITQIRESSHNRQQTGNSKMSIRVCSAGHSRGFFTAVGPHSGLSIPEELDRC